MFSAQISVHYKLKILETVAVFRAKV